MEIQSWAGLFARHSSGFHRPPASRHEAFRELSGEEICRMPKLRNRDFVSVSIPHRLSGDTIPQFHGRQIKIYITL